MKNKNEPFQFSVYKSKKKDMAQNEQKSQDNKLLNFLSDKSPWIATILLISGFIVESIDKQTVLNGKSFHQLTIAPILLLMGYSLFIFVILKKLKI
jgi:hypothetical protein